MKPSMKRHRFENLAEELKREITCGRYSPGARLPTFEELGKRYGSSRGVLQLSISLLKNEGFVVSRNRHGLYVNEHPPHLCRYALVFPAKRTEEGWNRLCHAIVNEAEGINNHKLGIECLSYEGLSVSDNGNEDYKKLRMAVESQVLAGLILFPGTFHLREQLHLEELNVPVVYVYSHPSDGRFPLISSSNIIHRKALSYLFERSRKRIASVYMADISTCRDDFREFMGEIGLECNPNWIVPVGRSHPETVGSIIRLLFERPAESCPDGLYISDDNLVEYAIGEVIRLDKKIGRDIDIVAHCNWPWPIPTVVPIQRIGFDTAELVLKCIETIDDIRDGVEPPREQYIEPLFESEYKALKNEM